MLNAALELFTSRGYEATTMQDVADAAGVAVQTVYFGFRTKAQLLSEVGVRALLRDGPTSALRDQSWFAAIGKERDAHKVLVAFVTAASDIIGRITAFAEKVGASLRMDQDAVEDRDRQRDDFFRVLVDRLNALGALRPGLTPNRAMDIVRVTLTVEGYADLLQRRGWTRDEWKALMVDMLDRELLKPKPPIARNRGARSR